jgi:4-nitrophenol 2-monooxygenase / 4-nitrocatechol 4-monooxygenase, reductase component
MSDELVVAVEESTFKRALSHFASGVTVVTTEYNGEWFGITVSAFCSVSLHPPLVLICIDKSVRAHDAIAKAERYAVNILRDDQEHLSRRFASRIEDKFDGIPTRMGLLKVPLLEGTLTTIECRLRESLPGGDHTIYVGEVVSAGSRDGNPLIYFSAGYHTVK